MDDDKAEGGAPPIGTAKDPSEFLSSAAVADGVEEKDDTAELLASLFGGIGPEEIPEFRRAQELIPAYQLLHGLVGRNELDFLIRAAALEALVACGRASFSQHELNEALYWLSEYGRDRTVRALREAGWLEYRPGAGDIVTNAGSSAYEILQLLRRKLESDDILPTVASLGVLTDQALELALREGSPSALAMSYAHQSNTRHWRGDLAGAEKYYAAGLRFFDDPGFRPGAGARARPDTSAPRFTSSGNAPALWTFGTASYTAWLLGRADVARERQPPCKHKMASAVFPERHSQIMQPDAQEPSGIIPGRRTLAEMIGRAERISRLGALKTF